MTSQSHVSNPSTAIETLSARMHAALLEQLVHLVGEPDVDAKASKEFNAILFRIASAVEPSHDMAVGGSEAVPFDNFLSSAWKHLRRALDDGAQHAGVKLSLADACVLRMAAFALSKQGDSRHEYDAALLKLQTETELYQFTKSKEERREWMTCNDVVAEEFSKKMDRGLSELCALSSSGNDGLLDFLQTAAPVLCGSLTMAALPPLLDGQRLRAALQIAHDNFGSSRYLYGLRPACKPSKHEDARTERCVADKVLLSRKCEMAAKRVLYSIGIFVALSTVGLTGQPDSPQRAAAFAALAAFKAAVEALCKRKPSKEHLATHLASIFANWFAEATGDAAKYMCIAVALRHPGLLPFNCDATFCGDMEADFKVRMRRCRQPDEPTKRASARLRPVSVLEAAQSVGQWGEKPLNFHVAVSVVWAGAVLAAVVDADVYNTAGDSDDSAPHLGGPFYMSGGVWQQFYSFVKADGITTLNTDLSHTSVPDDPGTACKPTAKAIEACTNDYSARNKNRCCLSMSEARLWGALHALCVHEAFSRKLGGLMTPGFADKCTNLPLVYISAMACSATQQLPCCLGDGGVSNLVERCRTPREDKRSISDACKTPWRDLCGSAVVSSLLYHIGQDAFIDASTEIIDSGDSKYFTLDALAVFCRRLRMSADASLDVNTAISELRVDGRVFAHKVFYVFRSFIEAYIASVSSSRRMWDGVTSVYSPNKHAGESATPKRARDAPPASEPAPSRARLAEPEAEPAADVDEFGHPLDIWD